MRLKLKPLASLIVDEHKDKVTIQKRRLGACPQTSLLYAHADLHGIPDRINADHLEINVIGLTRCRGNRVHLAAMTHDRLWVR